MRITGYANSFGSSQSMEAYGSSHCMEGYGSSHCMEGYGSSQSMEGWAEMKCDPTSAYGLASVIGAALGAAIGYMAMPPEKKKKGAMAGAGIGFVAGLGAGYYLQQGCALPGAAATPGATPTDQAQQAATMDSGGGGGGGYSSGGGSGGGGSPASILTGGTTTPFYDTTGQQQQASTVVTPSGSTTVVTQAKQVDDLTQKQTIVDSAATAANKSEADAIAAAQNKQKQLDMLTHDTVTGGGPGSVQDAAVALTPEAKQLIAQQAAAPSGLITDETGLTGSARAARGKAAADAKAKQDADNKAIDDALALAASRRAAAAADAASKSEAVAIAAAQAKAKQAAENKAIDDALALAASRRAAAVQAAADKSEAAAIAAAQAKARPAAANIAAAADRSELAVLTKPTAVTRAAQASRMMESILPTKEVVKATPAKTATASRLSEGTATAKLSTAAASKNLRAMFGYGGLNGVDSNSLSGWYDIQCSAVQSYGLGALIGILLGSGLGYAASTNKKKGATTGGGVGLLLGLGIGYWINSTCVKPAEVKATVAAQPQVQSKATLGPASAAITPVAPVSVAKHVTPTATQIAWMLDAGTVAGDSIPLPVAAASSSTPLMQGQPQLSDQFARQTVPVASGSSATASCSAADSLTAANGAIRESAARGENAKQNNAAINAALAACKLGLPYAMQMSAAAAAAKALNPSPTTPDYVGGAIRGFGAPKFMPSRATGYLNPTRPTFTVPVPGSTGYVAPPRPTFTIPTISKRAEMKFARRPRLGYEDISGWSF